jgi:hypothetical protein
MLGAVGWANGSIVNPTLCPHNVGLRKACSPTYGSNPLAPNHANIVRIYSLASLTFTFFNEISRNISQYR